MTFSELVRDTELYIHLEGAEVRHLIKQFISDSILDFVRLKNWSRVNVFETITLDGSGSYLLSNLMNNFSGEIGLYSGATQYTKTKYENYIQYSSKSGLYAIYGDRIYIEGDNVDLTFMFKSTGYKYVAFSIYSYAANEINISGDISSWITNKNSVIVSDSADITGTLTNDGTYTFLTGGYAVAGGNTTITTIETVPNIGITNGFLLVKRKNIVEFDTDEAPVIEFYPDVIQKMAALKMFKYLDDAESSDREAALLSLKINTLKADENRTEKMGVPHIVKR